MSKSNLKFEVSALISTYFYIGKIKCFPGTWGSFFTFPLFILINIFFSEFKMSFFLYIFLSLLIVFSIFIISYFTITEYIKITKKKDPSEVVIDEVIGQLIAYMLPMFFIIYYSNYFNTEKNYIKILIFLFPFIFFRLFDITKPNLVGFFDKKVNGAIGIIMDDVIAGIYSGIIVIILLFISLKIF